MELKNIENHKICKKAFTLAEDATHVANWKNSRKIAFTEPSRGMSGAKVEQTSAGTLSFRCVCERCRLTRGEVHNENRKVAFTLAETLITLGIIGVVAAMTLPTLIANYQKQVYANGLKKGINISLNMLKKMQADEGVSSLGETELFTSATNCDNAICNDEDGYNDPSVFERIIPKYLKVVKTCKGDNCNIKYKNSSLICPNYDYTSKNCKLSVGNELLPIGELTASYSDHGITPPIVGFYTSDGMIFYMYKWTLEPTLEMLIDINGEKAPNIIERDVFPLRLSSRGLDLESGIYYKTLHLVANGYKMDY